MLPYEFSPKAVAPSQKCRFGNLKTKILVFRLVSRFEKLMPRFALPKNHREPCIFGKELFRNDISLGRKKGMSNYILDNSLLELQSPIVPLIKPYDA